jgi:hypothetical protein
VQDEPVGDDLHTAFTGEDHCEYHFYWLLHQTEIMIILYSIHWWISLWISLLLTPNYQTEIMIIQHSLVKITVTITSIDFYISNRDHD